MKLLLLTITTIVAFANALPSTAPDAVVPEMNLAQADSPAKAAKKTIQAMLASGSDDSACADLAQTTLDEVTDSVAERQGILNDLDTGADCPNTMAGEVSAAETALSDAETARTEADTAAATAQSADVHFDSMPFSSLHEGECATFFDDAGYTSAKANAESTAAAAAAAASTVTAMQTTLETTREAQTKAIKDCQCHAYAQYESAWSAATSHESDDAAAWQKGKHMQCVLEGTDPETCDVGTVPTVSPITLAPGVDGEGCSQENNEGNNEPIVPACQCNEEAPAFMQLEEGTDMISSYKINTPVNGGSPIPHPGGVIKIAWRCEPSEQSHETYCNYPASFFGQVFNDGNQYQVTKVNSVTEVSEDTAVLWDILPGSSHSDAEMQFLEAFLERGGRLIMTGENSYFARQNAIVSETVKALGGGISVNHDGHSKEIFAAHINNLQVNSGLTFIKPNYWASLSVDKEVSEVLCTSDHDKIFAADQMLRKGRVTIWADINIFQHLTENADFFKNLVHQGMNFVAAVAQGGNPNAAGPCQC